jgi:hypothetical protein
MMENRTCEVCAARVVDLRRGRCFVCYSKWADARPVGMGGSCAICNDRRRENLRQMELLGAWVPMCYNCAGKTMKLAPLPRTLEAIRKRLARERRGNDRRSGQPDLRFEAQERRGLERRSVGHATHDGDLLLVDDMLIELLDEDVLEPRDLTEETRIVVRT